MKLIKWLVVGLSILAFSMSVNALMTEDQNAAIAATMHQQWDQPDQKLEILVIVSEYEFAIVDWILGDKGGRALLKFYEEKNLWQTFMCGGSGLTDINGLQHAGIPLTTAQKLLHDLRTQEQNLDPKQKALINSFQGVIKFTQEAGVDHHPHTHEHK